MFKKSSDYDPNLSWDKIFKSWEENVLGKEQYLNSNVNFNYDLESDISFDNALVVNTDENMILASLFDINFYKNNKKKFTCVNTKSMYLMDNYDGVKKIQQKNTWSILRNCDYLSKPFFRFVLKKNLTQSDISDLMYLLADCRLDIMMGGAIVMSIPKFLFNFLICEKLSNPIKIFDVKSFLESNTMDEIRNKILKFTEKSSWVNQKYYVNNPEDKYLDIPLLIDFFSYNMSTMLIALQFHDVRYQLNIPDNKINLIKKYIDDIVLMFEEIVYTDSEQRQKIALTSLEFLKMNSSLDYFHCWNGNQIILNGHIHTKFIFIIIRPHESNNFESELINQIDNDIDITQLPQIINVELNSTSLIDLENIWTGQYDNIIVYGIAADGYNSMKNWINVLKEGINSAEKIDFINNNNNNNNNNKLLYKYNFASNYNMFNTNEIYKCVNLDKIKIVLSESSIPVNIEIIHIQQNLQRYMGGLTGDAFCV